MSIYPRGKKNHFTVEGICGEKNSFHTVGKIPRKYMKIFDYEIKVSYL